MLKRSGFRSTLAFLTATAVLAARPGAAAAQRTDSTADTARALEHDGALHLTVSDWGLAIGNARRVNGIRLNYRDHGPVLVNGLNATIWTPYDPADGDVRGVALGVPLTGARRIRGLGIGLGVAADRDIGGVVLAGIGAGAGGRIDGILVAGLGSGAGKDVRGIAIGGLGTGAGGSLRGLAVGGLGVGAGGDLWGIAIGGLGAGAGRNLTGLSVGGVGVGAGGNLTGISIGGVGVGAGGRARGVIVAGVGAGAGELLEGLVIAGIGAGAPNVRALVISPAAGGESVRGVMLAPAYFRISQGGSFTGLSVSAFNHIRGVQHGLVIGIFNYARELHGVQLGVLNFAGNNHGWSRLLPLVNVHH